MQAKLFTLPPGQIWIDHVSIDQTNIDNWPTWTPGLRPVKQFKKSFAAPGSFFLMTLDEPFIKRLVLPNVVYQNDRHRIEQQRQKKPAAKERT
jgi:hypothetical protein